MHYKLGGVSRLFIVWTPNPLTGVQATSSISTIHVDYSMIVSAIDNILVFPRSSDPSVSPIAR